MAFQGNAFQGNAFQDGNTALANPLALRAPTYYRRDVANALAGVFATLLGSSIAILSGTTPATPAPPALYDWPNPPGLQRGRPDFIAGVNLNLVGQDRFFGAPGQGPVYDYPNPRGYAYPTELRTHLDPLKILLLVPSRQLDWPNPLGPRRNPDFIGPVNLSLVGQDQFFGAPGQGPVYDYPNPRGYQFPIDLRTQLQSTAPYLQTTAPFYQTQWPNPPLAAQPATSLRTHLDPLKLTLLVPFAQTDWPLPPRAAPYPISLRTHIERNISLLNGQDTIYGANGQVPTYDWQNPRGPLRGNQYFVDRNLAALNGKDTIYGANGEVPAYDWQNPRGYQYAITLRTWTEHNTPLLYGQDTFFGEMGQGPANLDWPVPKGPVFPIDLRTFYQGFYIAPQTPPQLPPFAYDYPNPRAYQFSNEFRTWTQGITALTQVHTPSPTNYDFPNPRGPQAAIDLRTQTNSTAPYIPVDKPFVQADWPNPRAAQFSNEFRTFTQTFFLGNNNALPPTNYDWPNPRGPMFARDMLSLWDFRKLGYQDTFFGGPGQPPANLDWPNPRGYPFPMDLRTIAHSWPEIFPPPTPAASTSATFPFIHNVGSLMQRS